MSRAEPVQRSVLVPVEVWRDALLAVTAPLPPVARLLQEAEGSVLAEPVRSRPPVPS